MKQVRESEMEKTESAFESDSSSLRTPGDVKKATRAENTTPRRTIGGVGVRVPPPPPRRLGRCFSQKAFVRPSFPIVVLPTRDKIDVELVRELVHSLIRRKIIEREGRRPSSAVVASRKRDTIWIKRQEREKKVSKRHEKRRRRCKRPHTKKPPHVPYLSSSRLTLPSALCSPPRPRRPFPPLRFFSSVSLLFLCLLLFFVRACVCVCYVCCV